MSVKICSIGVVSAIGIGVEQNLCSLLSQRCGIGSNTLFETSIGMPVAQIPLKNKELAQLLGINEVKHSRTALLGAIAAREAMKTVSIAEEKRVGLINSTSVGGMDLSEEFYRDFINNSSSGRLRNIVGHDTASSTDFIAQMCGIDGFRTTISTACSSSANAVIMGAMMLERGLLDYVLVGGTDSLCRFTLCGFNSLMILDSELCRPFDQSRTGLNLGEGAGFLLLTKDIDADAICTLSGYANANDAHHQTASSVEGQGAFLAMVNALKSAGLNAECIDYINLHGTGTVNNDSSETAAIKRIFKDIPRCSSTKSYTGHTLAAAGALEAIYSVFAITNNCCFSNLRFSSPIDNGIIPIKQIEKNIEIKHVLSNSFGFGGNCSTLIFSKL